MPIAAPALPLAEPTKGAINDSFLSSQARFMMTTDAIGEKLSLDLFEHYRQISFSPTPLILKRSSV
jgi:hypothetical protein